jgi:Holliday junction resolvase RusA-like endonuclease
MIFVADDMVACNNAGGRSISFVMKGSATIHRKNIMPWKGCSRPLLVNPSSSNMLLFCEAVRLEMEVIGLPMEVKFILSRRRMDLVMQPSPPHLTANAPSFPHGFPHGKDIDNLLKFVMDELEQTLYKNDINILCGGVKKCCASDIMEKVGWTEVHFWKVVCID